MNDTRREKYEQMYLISKRVTANMIVHDMWNVMANFIQLHDFSADLVLKSDKSRCNIDFVVKDIRALSNILSTKPYLTDQSEFGVELGLFKPIVALCQCLISFFNRELHLRGWRNNYFLEHYDHVLDILSLGLEFFPKLMLTLVTEQSQILEELLNTCEIHHPFIPYGQLEETKYQIQCNYVKLCNLHPLKRDLSVTLFYILSGCAIGEVNFNDLLDIGVVPPIKCAQIEACCDEESNTQYTPKTIWSCPKYIFNRYTAGKLLDENYLPSVKNFRVLNQNHLLVDLHQDISCESISDLIIDACHGHDDELKTCGKLYGIIEGEVGYRVLLLAESEELQLLYKVDVGEFSISKKQLLFHIPKLLVDSPFCCEIIHLIGFSPSPNTDLLLRILVTLEGLMNSISNKTAPCNPHLYFVLHTFYCGDSIKLAHQAGKVILTLSQHTNFEMVYPDLSSLRHFLIDCLLKIAALENPSVAQMWVQLCNNLSYHSSSLRNYFIHNKLVYALLRLLNELPMLESHIWTCLRSLFNDLQLYRLSNRLDQNELKYWKSKFYEAIQGTRESGTTEVKDDAFNQTENVILEKYSTVQVDSNYEVIGSWKDDFNSLMVKEVVCGMLNSGEGGQIIIGAEEYGNQMIVQGVYLNRDDKDVIRLYFNGLHNFYYPKLYSKAISVSFNTITNHDEIKSLFLVRVFIDPVKNDVYLMKKMKEFKAYLRVGKSNKELRSQEVRELYLKRQQL